MWHCSWCFTQHSASPQPSYKAGVLLTPLSRWGRGRDRLSKLQLRPRWSGSSVHTLNQIGMKTVIVQWMNSPYQQLLSLWNILYCMNSICSYSKEKRHISSFTCRSRWQKLLLPFKPLKLRWAYPHFTIKSVLTTQVFQSHTAKAKSLGAISEFLWFPLINSAFRKAPGEMDTHGGESSPVKTAQPWWLSRTFPTLEGLGTVKSLSRAAAVWSTMPENQASPGVPVLPVPSVQHSLHLEGQPSSHRQADVISKPLLVPAPSTPSSQHLDIWEALKTSAKSAGVGGRNPHLGGGQPWAPSSLLFHLSDLARLLEQSHQLRIITESLHHPTRGQATDTFKTWALSGCLQSNGWQLIETSLMWAVQQSAIQL